MEENKNIVLLCSLVININFTRRWRMAFARCIANTIPSATAVWKVRRIPLEFTTLSILIHSRLNTVYTFTRRTRKSRIANTVSALKFSRAVTFFNLNRTLGWNLALVPQYFASVTTHLQFEYIFLPRLLTDRSRIDN